MADVPHAVCTRLFVFRYLEDKGVYEALGFRSIIKQLRFLTKDRQSSKITIIVQRIVVAVSHSVSTLIEGEGLVRLLLVT